MDKIILEFVHPDEKVVGYYSVLVVLVGLFTLISQSLTPFMVPIISKYLKDKTLNKKIQSMINNSNIFLFILSLMLFLTYVFYGKEILSFYGKNGEYTIVYLSLIYLSISQIFLETARLGLRMVLYAGFIKFINQVFISSIILLFFLGVILTYYYGLYGIIIAHIISSFIYMLAFMIKVRKEFKDIKVFSII